MVVRVYGGHNHIAAGRGGGMRRLVATLAAVTVMLQSRPAQTWNFQLMKAVKEARFIEENGLEYVRLSCYLPTGNCCADGTWPYEGVVACNAEHLGMTCILYDKDLNEAERFECHDVGGHPLLMSGKAIDIFRETMDGAWEIIGRYGDYAYIKWIPGEGQDGDGSGASGTEAPGSESEAR